MLDSQGDTNDLSNGQSRLPQPGEIWEVRRFPDSYRGGLPAQRQQLEGERTRPGLPDELPARYVTLIRDGETQETGSIVFVMVLSEETQFLNSIDLLIPSELSGFDRDLLAETWHVFPLFAWNLSRAVGKRLSREIYDCLLDVGDADLGLLPQPPSRESIQCLGLKVGSADVLQPEIQEFHQREREWSDRLNAGQLADRVQPNPRKFAERIVEAALEVEREWATYLPIEERFSLGGEVAQANLSDNLKAGD